jgi:hypothetical protein
MPDNVTIMIDAIGGILFTIGLLFVLIEIVKKYYDK